MIQFISSQTLLGLDALAMYIYVMPVLSLAGSELWSQLHPASPATSLRRDDSRVTVSDYSIFT